MKWQKIKLGSLFQIKHGWAFKGEYFSNEGQLIIITPGNFFEKGGFRQLVGKEKFYLGEFPEEFLLKRNDVVIAMTEQGPGLLGSPALIPSDEKYLHNQRIGLIHNVKTDMIDPLFIYRLFFTSIVRNEIFGSATGTKVKHTAPKRIYDIEVPNPPITTQRKIVSILSAYDDLIENNLKRIKLLEEQARIAFKSIQKNEHLELKKAVEVLQFTTGKLNSNAAVQNGLFPFFTCGQEILKTNTFSVDDEVVLLGGNNASAIYPVFYYKGKFDAYQRTYIIKPKQGVYISFKYLYFFWEDKLDYLKNISTGAATKFLTLKILNDIDIPLPNKKVMDDYEKLTDPIFKLKAILTEQNTKLREARDILLPKLMNGQIEV